MKRRRPKQHYRRIKTKKGKKRILINKGIKRRKVKRRKRSYGYMPTVLTAAQIKKALKKPIHALSDEEYEALRVEGHFAFMKFR